MLPQECGLRVGVRRAVASGRYGLRSFRSAILGLLVAGVASSHGRASRVRAGPRPALVSAGDRADPAGAARAAALRGRARPRHRDPAGRRPGARRSDGHPRPQSRCPTPPTCSDWPDRRTTRSTPRRRAPWAPATRVAFSAGPAADAGPVAGPGPRSWPSFSRVERLHGHRDRRRRADSSRCPSCSPRTPQTSATSRWWPCWRWPACCRRWPSTVLLRRLRPGQVTT